MKRFILFIFFVFWTSLAYAETLKVGLFTGTFDPPHLGHEEVLKDAIEKLKLDIVYVVPNFTTPHKPNATPYWLRKKMAIEGFSEIPNVIVAADFLEKAFEQGGPAQILSALRDAYKDAKIIRIIGDDSYESLHDDLKNSEAVDDFFVIQRTENGLSSTKVRKMVADGETNLPVHQRVLDLIKANCLYVQADTCTQAKAQ